GSDIRFGHEVRSVRQDGDCVTVTAETPSGAVSIAGRYLIAADGARSAVRRSLGVEFEGFTYPELFLIASTDFKFEETLTDIAHVNYIADPLEWLVLLRVPDLWRVLVPAPENSDREKLLSDESLQGVLHRVVPRPESYKIVHRSIYQVHQRVAKKFRHGARGACRRCRAHQQSAGRHGDERWHAGRFQPGRQIQGHRGGRRCPAARSLPPPAPHRRGGSGAGAHPPQPADH